MYVTLGGAPKREDFVGLLLECHERIRAFSRLAVEVGARVDLQAPEVVEACRRCERYFTEALPRHVEDEEETLLPGLRGRSVEVDEALTVMHAQHEAHRPLLIDLLAALGDVRLVPGDLALRPRLATVAERVRQDFEAHLSLEERVLFPAVTATWSAEQSARAVEALRARRRPAVDAS
ncbi:MAG: hemerythrin domain-containing protein [Myxococcaceae bacterium]|nr:hemerythrin domain-containing protein [Myxococcaceae bacterium]